MESSVRGLDQTMTALRGETLPRYGTAEVRTTSGPRPRAFLEALDR
jgi:hypothetical protein